MNENTKEKQGYDKITKTYGWYLSDIKDLEENIETIKHQSQDLSYPQKTLEDLIDALEYFLPLVGPGTDYDNALNNFLNKRELAKPKGFIKKLSVKFGIEEQISYKNEKKLFYEELHKVEKFEHPAGLNNTLEDWYKGTFSKVYPQWMSSTVLKSLNLKDDYCREFYCPNLDMTSPSIRYDETFMSYDQEQIDASYKQIEIYKKKLSSGEYKKDLKEKLDKAKNLLEKWIVKIRECQE